MNRDGDGQRFMSTVKLGPKGQIVIPKEVREMFGLEPGDSLLLLADAKRGIALQRSSVMTRIADAIFSGHGPGGGRADAGGGSQAICPGHSGRDGGTHMNAVETKGLTKHFGPVQALSGLDLAVPAGTLYALLGVNGAGKSTAIKILTGLLPPSGGEARILGYDVVRQREAVKRRISLCPQDTAVAPNLTAEENLILLAGLSGARRKEARARTEALLESLQLQPVARRPGKNALRRVSAAAEHRHGPHFSATGALPG